jgi:hypothetical protein
MIMAQGWTGLQLLNYPHLTYEPDRARICWPAVFLDQPSTAFRSLPPLPSESLNRPSWLPPAHALTCSPAHALARQAQRQHPAHMPCTRPGLTTHAPSHRLARPPAALRPLHWPVPRGPRPCHHRIPPAGSGSSSRRAYCHIGPAGCPPRTPQHARPHIHAHDRLRGSTWLICPAPARPDHARSESSPPSPAGSIAPAPLACPALSQAPPPRHLPRSSCHAKLHHRAATCPCQKHARQHTHTHDKLGDAPGSYVLHPPWPDHARSKSSPRAPASRTAPAAPACPAPRGLRPCHRRCTACTRTRKADLDVLPGSDVPPAHAHVWLAQIAVSGWVILPACARARLTRS